MARVGEVQHRPHPGGRGRRRSDQVGAGPAARGVASVPARGRAEPARGLDGGLRLAAHRSAAAARHGTPVADRRVLVRCQRHQRAPGRGAGPDVRNGARGTSGAGGALDRLRPDRRRRSRPGRPAEPRRGGAGGRGAHAAHRPRGAGAQWCGRRPGPGRAAVRALDRPAGDGDDGTRGVRVHGSGFAAGGDGSWVGCGVSGVRVRVGRGAGVVSG